MRSSFSWSRKFHIETAIVEIDNLAQGFGRSVREVGGAGSQPAELLHDDRADIDASAGNERAARIGRVDDAAEIRMRIRVAIAGDLEDRELARFRPRRGFGPGGVVGGADVDPSGREILAGHLGVVAGGARPLQRIAQADGVNVRGIAQPELAKHKDVRAPGDRCAIVIVSLPGSEEPEDRIVVVIA